jgi:hypothetical protein
VGDDDDDDDDGVDTEREVVGSVADAAGADVGVVVVAEGSGGVSR